MAQRDFLREEPAAGAPSWKALAACRGATEVFFPVLYQDSQATGAHAKAVCAECEVRPECLEAGLMEKFGVWGGLTERERVALRRKRARSSHE